MSARFPKSHRVVRRVDFVVAQKKGRRLHAPHFVLVLYDRRDEGPARLGLATSRKVANAVGRNRVRRRVRELFRTEPLRFPAHHDVVVIAKEGAADLDSRATRDEILAALDRRRGGPGAARQGERPPVKPA